MDEKKRRTMLSQLNDEQRKFLNRWIHQPGGKAHFLEWEKEVQDTQDLMGLFVADPTPEEMRYL